MAKPGKRVEWTIKLGRPLGTPLAKGIAKLPIKIHPNYVTLVSLILILIAAYCFFRNLLLFGAIFYYVGYVVDTADGALARLTNTQSRFGERLDFYFDTIGNVFMYFGLWYSQYYLAGNWFLGGSIIAAHYVVIALGYMFLATLMYKTIFKTIGSYYSHADEGIITFCFLPIFAAFIPGLFPIVFPILVILQFISFVILFIIQKDKPNVKEKIKKTLKL